MEFTLSIFSSEEELSTARNSIQVFLDTYGDCQAKLYPVDTPIDEDGMIIHGSYGILDALFTPISDPRLSLSPDFADGRQLLEWNMVIYTVE